METGGVSKAMTSLLAVLDRTRVTPELLIVSPHGTLMPLIPDDVHIYTDRRMAVFPAAGIGGLWPLVRLGRPDLAVMSMIRMAVMRVSRCAGAGMLARLMPRLKGRWDAVVDFNGQHQLYYMARKIEADRRATLAITAVGATTKVPTDDSSAMSMPYSPSAMYASKPYVKFFRSTQTVLPRSKMSAPRASSHAWLPKRRKCQHCMARY